METGFINQVISGLNIIGSTVMPLVAVITDTVRFIFFLLDSLIYSLVPVFYEFCKYLAGVEFIVNETEVLNTIAKSIYSLLSIIMLIKLAFSLLTLMADPDKVEDKEKGVGKLLTNVITTLVLIMVIPLLFRGAAYVQDKFLGVVRDDDGIIKELKAGIIDKVLIQGNPKFCSKYDECPSVGTFLAQATLGTFFSVTPDTNASQNKNRDDLKIYEDVFTSKEFPLAAIMTSVNNKTNRIGTGLLGELLSGIDFLGLVSNTYVFSYMPIISTAFGLYLIWVFISLAIDITTRSIKLFALKLISPIPIVSYLDTNSQTKGMFKKWTDEVVKTYLSIFIRLAALSIVGMVIKSIDWADLNIFIKLFFFLGMLTFLKTAPKMLENIFGYSRSKEEGFGASLLRGAIGAGAAGTAGMIAGGISSKENNLGFGIGALHGGLAGLTGGWKGAQSGKFGEFGKAFIGGGQAAGKALGYKGGMDLLKEKMAFGSQVNAAKSTFSKFKDTYDNSFNDDEAKGVLGELAKDGLHGFQKEDAVAAYKIGAVEKAAKRIFKKPEYAAAFSGFDKANRQKQMFDRAMKRAQVAATRAGVGSQEDKYYNKLVSLEGKYIKKYNDAKERIEQLNKDPEYTHDRMIYDQYNMGDKIPKDDNFKDLTTTPADIERDNVDFQKWQEVIWSVDTAPEGEAATNIERYTGPRPAPEPGNNDGFTDGGGI